MPEQVTVLELEISRLRQEMQTFNQQKADLETELNSSKLKNGKLLVKVKTLTKQMETLKRSSSGGFGDDLDKALEEEMNNQVEKAKSEVREVRKEMETLKAEKASLERKLDTLEGGNERMLELKEQQN